MHGFREWIDNNEAGVGYVVSAIGRTILLLSEGRKNPERLRGKEFKSAPMLFSKDELNPTIQLPSKKILGANACPITPLSGYEKHIKAIQQYAMAGPDQFAQTMIFSPLSANVPFAKHWDNFHVLMLILKHYFPKTVDIPELRRIVDTFSDTWHALGHTIASFKLNTIAYIWNNKEKLFQELIDLSKEEDDFKLIARLSQIPGVLPVKAGFMAQLLFGKAGCIDTHNIDIYSKVYPELIKDLDFRKWDRSEGGIESYIKTLQKLEKKGIGTKQLWDVWVDFVEHFYKITSEHGGSMYADMGSALDPSDPAYQALKDIKIPKTRVGQGFIKNAMVPLVSGKHGLGASATHLQTDPDEILKQFNLIYRQHKKGSEAASAIPYQVDKYGRPLEKSIGMPTEPSSLHYFGKALDNSGEVDPEYIKKIIRDRINRPSTQQGVLPGVSFDKVKKTRLRAK